MFSANKYEGNKAITNKKTLSTLQLFYPTDSLHSLQNLGNFAAPSLHGGSSCSHPAQLPWAAQWLLQTLPVSMFPTNAAFKLHSSSNTSSSTSVSQLLSFLFSRRHLGTDFPQWSPCPTYLHLPKRGFQLEWFFSIKIHFLLDSNRVPHLSNSPYVEDFGHLLHPFCCINEKLFTKGYQ